MTSTLDLMQQVQKKSEERAKSFSEINQTGFEKLSESTLKQVQVSESTTKNGITESSQNIIKHTKDKESSIVKQVTTSGQNIVTQVQETEIETTQALNSLRTLIRKILGNWLAVALSVFVIFALGMSVGVALIKIISKPYQPTYQYHLDKKTGITYLVPLED